jgi:hypothetical protein
MAASSKIQSLLPTECEYGIPTRIKPTYLTPDEREKARTYAMNAGLDTYRATLTKHPARRIYNLVGNSCYYRANEGSEFVKCRWDAKENRVRLS